MSANKELAPKNETRLIPTPGTQAHLEYLRNFEPSDEHLSDPNRFISDSMAATSLARVFRRHRTYWPLRGLQTADMDSRFFDSAPEEPKVFRGSVGVRANFPEHNQVSVHAQHSTHTYDLVIPVTDNYFYDPARHIYAAYHYPDSNVRVYNEMAAPQYQEHDPQVLFAAVREAANDSLDLLHHMYGPISSLPEYPDVEVSWHPDYMNDDPNEFMTGINP